MDVEDRLCATCEHGAFSDAHDQNAEAEPVARKMVHEQHMDTIYFMGSSTIRHIYLNFVGSFRQNHNFTDHVTIEHYFHTHSLYEYNGTHDVFMISPDGRHFNQLQHLLPNVLLSVHFVWNADLKGRYDFEPNVHAERKVLVMGNHFWNNEFHQNIKTLTHDFLEASNSTSFPSELFWVDTWNKGLDMNDDHGWNHETRMMNRDVKEWINGLNEPHIHRINVTDILVTRFGLQSAEQIFTGFKMIEDGVHFQCNFCDKYPKTPHINNHKHQRIANCTDPIDDLILLDIYKKGSLY